MSKKRKIRMNEDRAKFCLEDNGEGQVKVEVEGTPQNLIYLLCRAMERTEHVEMIVTIATEAFQEREVRQN